MNDNAPLWLFIFVMMLSLISMSWKAYYFNMKFWDVFFGAKPVVIVRDKNNESL